MRYWNYIINNEGIHLFLSGGIPHEIYDFVIYSLCKLRNIPCLMFIYSPIDGVVFISNDWEQEPAKSIAQTYNQIVSQKPEKIILSNRFREHYERQTSRDEYPIPWYMDRKFDPNLNNDNFINITNPITILRKLKRAFDRREITDKVLKKMEQMLGSTRTQETFNFYDRNTITPDLSQKYIYIPLHYQPECSTSPMAGAFVNQLLIAQIIASFLPSNIYIYIKEHPFQTPYFRNINFYKDLLAIPTMEAHAVIGYIDINHPHVLQINQEENVNNLVCALRKRILELNLC